MEVRNANQTLSEFTGTEQYHKYLLGMVLTDGAKAMADNFQCYWFLDIICSYQPQVRHHDYQVWKLMRYEDTTAAIVSCDDGNGNIIVAQSIPFTDFKPHEGTIWVEGNVLLLPSEH